MERGKIRNRALAEQGRDYSEMRFGSITPTDIDGFIDFGDKLFVFVETKHEGAAMPHGQRLAYERLCLALEESKTHRAICLVVDHVTPCEQQINVGRCQVREVFWEGRWSQPQRWMQANSLVSVAKDKVTAEL